MRVLEALRSAAEKLEAAGIDDPLADAEVIVFHAAGTDRLAAYMENPQIDSAIKSRITRLVSRRVKGEPVQYVVGSVDFLGLHISVGRGVLIPRPETELLVRDAVGRLTKMKEPGTHAILDLCTGTGCIALALAKEFVNAEVTGVDTSKTALRYAKKNAASNHIVNARFLRGSIFEPVEGKVFDLIISNPPYIRADEIDTLQREVRDWEPREALDGGRDGLDCYRDILAQAGAHMKEGGLLMLELGFDQAGDVRKLAEKSGFRDIDIKRDYAGIERIFTARR